MLVLERQGRAVEASSGALRHVLVRWCADWQSRRCKECCGEVWCGLLGLGTAVEVCSGRSGTVGVARCGHAWQSR